MPAGDFRVRLDPKAIKSLEYTPAGAVLVGMVARRVRDKARENARPIAPDRVEAIVSTGAQRDADGVYADIGYDKSHPGFVLWWHEFGTRLFPARPHLRPAAASRVI